MSYSKVQQHLQSKQNLAQIITKDAQTREILLNSELSLTEQSIFGHRHNTSHLLVQF